MYIHFDKDEWEWLKEVVWREAINEANGFETVRMLVHIYDKMIEEEEWEKDREGAQDDITRNSQGE